jgi:hypothetical protein
VKYAVCALLVVAVVVAGLAYRSAYGNFPWAGRPDRVQWCDRTCYADRPPTRQSRPPGSRPVLRAVPLVGARFYAPAGSRCDEVATVLFRDDGSRRLVVYALSGGP